MSTLLLHFHHSRTVEGIDIAVGIRRYVPDADVEAVLDDRGAVAGYRLTLHFDTPEQCAEVAFLIVEELRDMGAQYRVE